MRKENQLQITQPLTAELAEAVSTKRKDSKKKKTMVEQRDKLLTNKVIVA